LESLLEYYFWKNICAPLRCVRYHQSKYALFLLSTLYKDDEAVIGGWHLVENGSLA
jgi:hypothetical protein